MALNQSLTDAVSLPKRASRASVAIVIKSKCLVHQVDTIKVSSSFAAQICVLGQAGQAFVPSHCQLAANVAGSISRFIPLSLRSLSMCVYMSSVCSIQQHHRIHTERWLVCCAGEQNVECALSRASRARYRFFNRPSDGIFTLAWCSLSRSSPPIRSRAQTLLDTL